MLQDNKIYSASYDHYCKAFYLFIVLFMLSCSENENNTKDEEDEIDAILYNKKYSNPLCLSNEQNTFVVENSYSLAERKIEYNCFLSPDSRVLFTTTMGGIACIIDVAKKNVEIDGKIYKVDCLDSGCNITISFEKTYQQQKVQVSTANNESEIVLTNDGEGGVGKGSVNKSLSLFEMPHGNYKLLLLSGGSILVNSIKISTPHKKLNLLIYGDSITETEMYYPSNLFPYSWVQLLCKSIPRTMSSAISGYTIKEIVERMKAELPFLDVKYVMITIGTNGGNTVDNLSEMIEYIQSQGMTPILNHIPCNESGTQVDVNKIIDIIRIKYGITGADFDFATSIDGFGAVLENKTMFWEDYGPEYKLFSHDYWHHPNEEGSKRMFDRIISDLPWLFNLK